MSLQRRAYQREALREFIETGLRVWAMLWERQSGKSTTFADMMLYEMLRHRARTCIYGSASLLLGTEIPLKIGQRLDGAQLIEKDLKFFKDFASTATAQCSERNMLFEVAAQDREAIPRGLSEDDFADLFKSAKLEFRVYHDRNSYSRTKVVAPNVATARGWSGTVFLDEVAFIRELRELLTALLPIISSNKSFKLLLATTPPEFDDTHYSFELLAPPAGLEFKPSATGNWYESEAGIRVHRADAFDTHLAGKKIFDLKNGEEITPEEAFRRAPNKDGHRIAHWLWWMLGGAAACDLLMLKTAQERGVGKCRCVQIDSDADFVEAMKWLATNMDPHARCALGLDKGTTTKEKSNPTVLSVLEEKGPEIINRLCLTWKSRDPEIHDERIEATLDTLEKRPGGRATALAIDATSEKLDAERQAKKFRGKIHVLLVVGSEGYDKPGLQKPTNYKQFTSEQYVGVLEDNHLTLPPEAYLRADHRLVLKDRGRFVCEPDVEGRHGDTFDANRLGLFALKYRGGNAVVLARPVGNFMGGTT